MNTIEQREPCSWWKVLNNNGSTVVGMKKTDMPCIPCDGLKPRDESGLCQDYKEWKGNKRS